MLEPREGFEPTTTGLQNRGSTIELTRQEFGISKVADTSILPQIFGWSTQNSVVFLWLTLGTTPKGDSKSEKDTK